MAEPIIPCPSLSLDGWVSATANKADYLISHFFLSEKSQTHIYQNEVSSLPWIIQNNQGNMSKTASVIQETLIKYFGRYFTNVEVEANFLIDPTNLSKVNIRLFVSFNDNDGKEFSLGRLVDILDSKIEKIANLNNTGVG